MLSEDDLFILLFLLLAMLIKRGLTTCPRGLSPVIWSVQILQSDHQINKEIQDPGAINTGSLVMALELITSYL